MKGCPNRTRKMRLVTRLALLLVGPCRKNAKPRGFILLSPFRRPELKVLISGRSWVSQPYRKRHCCDSSSMQGVELNWATILWYCQRSTLSSFNLSVNPFRALWFRLSWRGPYKYFWPSPICWARLWPTWSTPPSSPLQSPNYQNKRSRNASLKDRNWNSSKFCKARQLATVGSRRRTNYRQSR